MRQISQVAAAFILLVSLTLPFVAAATSYLPGQTLNPSCLPSDPTCVVVANTAGTFVATSSTATSTFAGNVAVSGNVQIGGLSGILKAIGGVITTALVNLASDVTGVLGITNGGTGTASVPAYGQVLVGNGSGGYVLTSTSSLGVAASNVAWGSITGSITSQSDLQAALSAKLSSSSLSASYPLAFNSSTGVISSAFGTTTANSYSALQTFNGGASSTNATSTNLFASIANFTSVVASTFNASVANIVGLTATNATTTNLAVTGTGYFAGSIGIGTTSPSRLLTIDSSSATGTILRLSNASSGGHIFDLLSTGSGNTGGAGRLDIFDSTAGAARLSIASNGNVGVGTTSPFANFSVNGSGYFGSDLTTAGNLSVTGSTTLATAALTGFPFSIKGSSNNTGDAAYDLYMTQIQNTTDASGTPGNQEPVIALGYDRNSGLDKEANLYIEHNEASPQGTAPYAFGGTFGMWVRGEWPNASSSISSAGSYVYTATSTGSSNGNHAGEDAAIVSGYGQGDSSLEVNSYGGMIHSLYVTAANYPWGGPNYVYPMNIAQFVAAGDTTGIQLDHSGAPTNGELFQINSTGGQQLIKIKGPLSTPGGAVTAGGAYADEYLSGNLVMSGGNILVSPSGTIQIGQTTSTSSEALSLSSAVSSTGITLYNTADQSTNFTRGQIYSNNGNFTIRTVKGGTGADWPLLLTNLNGLAQVELSTSGTDNSTGYVQISSGGGTANRYGVTIGNGTYSSASGGQWATGIIPTISQSGTAGYAALKITPTESSLGSGTHYLAQIGTSTAPNLVDITNAGWLGVGTSTPYSRLEVWGSDTASTSAFAVVNSASTTEFTVYDTGNAVLAGSLTQNSDQRLKTNISDLDGSSSLAAINALNPVTFNWIDPNKSSVPQFGFIAQDVQKVYPNLVSVTAPTPLTPDGTLSLNYIDLISPMISAIQELDKEMTSLASTVSGFAQSITSAIGNFGRVNTSELCDGSTCVTVQQLAAVIAAQGVEQAAVQAAGASPDATDTLPVIQVNGANPAIIDVGATYNDLGATITGPEGDLNLSIATFVNGVAMSPVLIDTSTAATDTVEYVVTDQNGLTSTSTRTVVVDATAEPTSASTTVTSQ